MNPDGKVALVAVIGRGLVDADTPVLTADDLGATRGDGCFDATRVTTDPDGHSRAENLDAHLDRLAASAAALDIDPPDHAQWRALIAEMLTAWELPGEAVLKLVLTRGREWAPGTPTAYATLVHRSVPLTGGDPFAARRGISAVTLSRGHPHDAYADAPWLLGGVKTLSYVVNAAAQREARRRGADDVLFVTTDGYCLDGPTSGLVVIHGNRLRTTPTGATGLLGSVTVDRIVTAARADGMDARHALIPVADLTDADGIWLVSSGRGPAPVRVLDGQALAVDEALVSRVAGYAGFAVPDSTADPAGH
ncbi:4-amino-4-deoxychorismate lyase [Austwickia chelonae]|uniref:Putative aminotransferase n=1 Tax=Austwickia chelonae NBRC 105200 TaxID=1184607 RepID=K6UNX4_9MICO|nr:aminodeoxychorismate lyase [Austwickia chelonae]GAB79331.1 putative aminotransferase [Austwickia chelonae NBRC 105200]SEW38376.1 4-amino-4-deoxychorismate lyase [Austwickia chelonae]